ncbi:eukaryotic translation initiation factor 2A isoform X2 [Daktulosphaira vitifoliae]|uniref:eukaryotic translation initiation factor 2A isoform X2 n=1 Tax=Daktulosphaira vitifoliae TaxID=58002 RepID=UPI0021AB0730|nr:eukaryotic translation initiation factor 2A isoform X2 [Daktulosphaira vitifoliae]
MTVPNLAVRGSTGLNLYQGIAPFNSVSTLSPELSSSCKFMIFSANGKHFAWINASKVILAKTNDWKIIAENVYSKATQLVFSSKGTYLVVYEPFITTPTNPKGTPNVHILKTATGELIKSFEYRDSKLWAPQWSSDEKVCARFLNGDVLFYENSNFDNIVHRIKGLKLNNYSISPTNQPINVLCFLPAKAGPSNGRLFMYPDFNNIIANKSFFQADRVEIIWNQKGTASLMLTSTDVDKTGQSYYGKQGLHLITTKGDTSQVIVNKEGPLYTASWSPSSNEFCVVYGFMPSKATLYNLKCDVVMEFGTGTFNAIYYNPFGNILLLAGFGNVQGNAELWDINGKKKIKKIDIPDTTYLQWSPDGQHFATATTAPRLKVGNTFKIWHYSGALLHEKPWGKNELFQVVWQNYSQGTFKTPTVVYKTVEGIASSQPIASKQVYRPPHARNSDFKPTSLHDDATDIKNQSKAYLKMKKKRQAKRQAKEQQEINDTNSVEQKINDSKSSIDDEKQKRFKKLQTDLKSINRIKTLQASGKELDHNQISRLKLENDLLKELQQLQI